MPQKRKRSYSVMCRCSQCGKSFRASRTDAKYCSQKCRTQAARSRAVQPEKINPSQPQQMTLDYLERLVDTFGYQIALMALE